MASRRARVRALGGRAVRAVPARAWVVIGLSTILAASALFGGLDDAAVRTVELPEVGVGDVFAGTEFTTVIESAQLLDHTPGLSLDPAEGMRYLMVTALVTNTWDRSTTDIDEILWIESLGADARGSSRAVLLSDGTSLPLLHPGVPDRVGFVWEVPVGEYADGDTVTLSILSRTLVTDSKLTFGPRWDDPVAVALVEVPVIDR